MAKSDRTRSHILDAARRLFNERGTAEVSTNQIAAEAGLSPGNLYYHFRDKREIIRRLHDQYAGLHEDQWRLGPDAAADLTRLRLSLAESAALTWEYRFLEREILALLQADPELRAAYQAVYRRRVDQWRALGERLVAAGLARRPVAPHTLHDLTIGLWLIAQYWLPFLEVTGDPDDFGQVARSGDLILLLLDPYLTAKGRRHFHASAEWKGEGKGR